MDKPMNSGGALQGIKVLDFSTLVPGPLATLVLAEAGADVLKVERPGSGDELRHYAPAWDGGSATFALLNRGKRSIALDLKSDDAIETLEPLLRECDIVIEQFRPGVMERLGLGYEQAKAINPRVIYCSISAYGQSGPMHERAGHDLNFMAESGILDLVIRGESSPAMPPVPIADIAGGTYPALVNILMALLARERTGIGCRIDIALADHLYFLGYWALAQGFATGTFPAGRDHLVTGASPRYALYRTRDERWVAVAAVEQKFWETLCNILDLPAAVRNDALEPARTRDAVAQEIARHDAEEWRLRFAQADCCCSIVEQLEAAIASPQVAARGSFTREIAGPSGLTLPALPMPIEPSLRNTAIRLEAPAMPT